MCVHESDLFIFHFQNKYVFNKDSARCLVECGFSEIFVCLNKSHFVSFLIFLKILNEISDSEFVLMKIQWKNSERKYDSIFNVSEIKKRFFVVLSHNFGDTFVEAGNKMMSIWNLHLFDICLSINCLKDTFLLLFNQISYNTTSWWYCAAATEATAACLEIVQTKQLDL